MRSCSQLVVDLSLLESNYKSLVEMCPHNEVIFMVKANAYGHGLDSIVHFAHGELGIREFGCASLEEAVQLRISVKGEFEIIVFSETCLGKEDCAELYGRYRLIPVISSLEGLDFFLKERDFRHTPLYIKFNIGMNRLGISPLQVENATAKIKAAGRRSIEHVMGHYACSFRSMEDDPINKESQESFQHIKRSLKGMGLAVEKTSSANSAAIEQGAGLTESHIRPGLMLYGPSGLDREVRRGRWRGRMISRLETEIFYTFPVEKGTPVGYGATPCPEKGKIVIVGLGYGDGFSTAYEGVELAHQGQRGTVWGRVSMDMAQIFFITEISLRVGDSFQIWGHDSSDIDRISLQSGVHHYELLCQLSVRLPRLYRCGG